MIQEAITSGEIKLATVDREIEECRMTLDDLVAQEKNLQNLRVEVAGNIAGLKDALRILTSSLWGSQRPSW